MASKIGVNEMEGRKSTTNEIQNEQECVTRGISETNEIGEKSSKLHSFLLGTIDSHSALCILRGRDDLLKKIWIYACSEWWWLHIQPYKIPKHKYFVDPRERKIYEDVIRDNIPVLKEPPEAKYREITKIKSMFCRKRFSGCPLAMIDYVNFPPPCHDLAGTHRYVNMMPFDLFEPEATLPEYLHDYIGIINQCRRYSKSYRNMEKGSMRRQDEGVEASTLDDGGVTDGTHSDVEDRIAYLTIDERPVLPGCSQRRQGVHVESPGAMRTKDVGDKSTYVPDLRYVLTQHEALNHPSWYYHRFFT